MPSAELTIRKIETHPVIIPLAEPLTTSSGMIAEVPLVLIDMVTEEGIVGRSYIFAYQPFALAPLNVLLRELSEDLEGKAVAPFELERSIRARFTLLGGARGLAGLALAGIDMAAWDAVAQAAEQPLVSLLGGRRRPVPAYLSLGMIREAQAAEMAERTLGSGFKAVKIKIGWPTLQEDLSVVRALRGRLPEEVAVMVDFNQSLGATEAIQRGRALDGEGIAWIEEPLPCDDFEGCAAVAAEVATPIQLGENFTGPGDFAAAQQATAMDYVMLDAQQIGGVTGWMRAAALAQTAGQQVSSHLFVEYSAHLLPVTPTCHWLEYLDVARAVLVDPPSIVDGCLEAPDRPGAGLVWDANAVKRHRVE